jgi:hypothetical protein
MAVDPNTIRRQAVRAKPAIYIQIMGSTRPGRQGCF